MCKNDLSSSGDRPATETAPETTYGTIQLGRFLLELLILMQYLHLIKKKCNIYITVSQYTKVIYICS